MDRCHSYRDIGESGSARKRTGLEVNCVCVIVVALAVGDDDVDCRRVLRIREFGTDDEVVLL